MQKQIFVISYLVWPVEKYSVTVGVTDSNRGLNWYGSEKGKTDLAWCNSLWFRTSSSWYLCNMKVAGEKN